MTHHFRRDRNTRRRTFAPAVDGARLEGRIVLSAVPVVELDPLRRTLNITGTDEADTVVFAEYDDSVVFQVNADVYLVSPADFDAIHVDLGRGDDQFAYYVEATIAGRARTVKAELGRGQDFGAVYVFGGLVDSSFAFDVDGGHGDDALGFSLFGATLERSSLRVNLAGAQGDDLVSASADRATVRDGLVDVAADAGPGNDLVAVLGDGGNQIFGGSAVRYAVDAGPGADAFDISPGFTFAGPDGEPVDVLVIDRRPRRR